MKAIRTGAAITTALLFAAGVAQGAPKPQAKSGFLLQAPTPAQHYAAWPKAASEKGLGGYGALRCKVVADGALDACKVIQESPGGYGFGAAMLALAPNYRVRTEGSGATPLGSDAVLPIEWLRFDTPSDWKRKPSPNDLLVVWPKKAWVKGVGGKATIHCMVSIQGVLFDCLILSEAPAGENFGSAAISLTPQFLMRPATLGGQPVISSVTIPLFFSLPAGAQPQTGMGSKSMADFAIAWQTAPSYADVVAAYPAKARSTKTGGRATINCSMTKEGRMGRCETVTEEPRDQGFAAAAKVLAKQFLTAPNMASGESVAGLGIQLPVTFDPSMLDDSQPLIGKPHWARLPSGADTADAFSKVQGGHGTVRVRLRCVVQQGGGLADCTVIAEEPANIGVGQGALALTPKFRVTTWTAEGLPTVGGALNIPIRYESGDAPPPATPPAKP